MTRMFNDPLLGTARVLILIAMAGVGAGAVLCLLGIPLTLFGRTALLQAIMEELPDTPASSTVWAIVGLLVLTTALLALVFLFLRQMKRIIDTVAEGDPFIPGNADRLRSMAWLMLGVQVLAIAVGTLGDYIEQAVKGELQSLSFEFDVNSLALILVLFILARVFRRGADMRDELEGTV